MEVWLLLLVFITGDAELKMIKHQGTYPTKAVCMQHAAKESEAKAYPKGTWFGCINMGGAIV